MFKTLNIDGKEVEFSANAATPFRYRQIFHKDLLSILGNEEKAQNEGVEAVTELAFIMAKQAEKADMGKLNEEVFFEWLEGFGSMAFVNNAEDILNIYMESTETTSMP
jgi:hypothetical protein